MYNPSTQHYYVARSTGTKQRDFMGRSVRFLLIFTHFSTDFHSFLYLCAYFCAYFCACFVTDVVIFRRTVMDHTPNVTGAKGKEGMSYCKNSKQNLVFASRLIGYFAPDQWRFCVNAAGPFAYEGTRLGTGQFYIQRKMIQS